MKEVEYSFLSIPSMTSRMNQISIENTSCVLHMKIKVVSENKYQILMNVFLEHSIQSIKKYKARACPIDIPTHAFMIM